MKKVTTHPGHECCYDESVPSTLARPRVNAVAIELTRYCNQKCGYCYNAFRAAPEAQGSDDGKLLVRVQRLLDQLDIGYFTLTGGEPFAYRGVFELLGLIRGRGIPVQFISNGGLFDDALAARLATFAPRSIQVTLNGPDADSHEALVGKGHFEKTVAGVRALRKHGVPVTGCIVVTRKNARRTGETLALWRELGIDRVALSRFSPAGYAVGQVAELLPSREDVIASFTQALPFARAGMSIQCTMPVPPCAIEVSDFSEIQFGSCAIGTDFQEIALGPDGKLRNCTLHGKAIGEGRDIADDDVDLRALVMHDDVKRYRDHVPEFCRGCLHEHTCGGGCGAAAEWVLGSRASVDPFVAQYTDDAFAQRLQNQRKQRLPLV